MSETTFTGASQQSLLQLLQSMPSLPYEFDESKNRPVMTFDAAELVRSVGILWNTVRDQRSFMDTLEREMARRKTEMEVRFKAMQSDVDQMIAQEARKRQQEDEKVRAELGALRSELKKEAEELRKENQEAQESIQRAVDRTMSTMKVGLAEAQSRVASLSSELAAVKEEVSQLRGERDQLQQKIDKNHQQAQSNHTLMCSFIGAPANVVQQAVSNGTEKDAFLKTPALQSLALKTRQVDERVENLKGEVHRVSTECASNTQFATRLNGDIQKLENALAVTDISLRTTIASEDDKLSQRILALEARGSSAALAPTALPQTTDHVPSAALESLRSMVQDLAALIARKSDRETTDKQLDDMQRILGRHETELVDLRGRVNELSHSHLHDSSVRVESNSSGPASTELLQTVQDLLNRLAAVEQCCLQLDQTKADRAEMRAALGDLAKRVEQGLAELYQQMNNIRQATAEQFTTVNSQDATAGRFRCISCNRDAGPLQEQVNERLSKSQFPPSPMLVQQQQRSVVQSRQAVPGLKEYGGNLTSSRKKLMNYYVWLQEKSDQGAASGGSRSRPTSAGKTRENGAPIVSPRTNSPGSQHPWQGAQSGGGTYGERQCGDHGSPEPEAVGLDGKYYVGVKSTHGSSRPKSAPLKRADPTAPALLDSTMSPAAQ